MAQLGEELRGAGAVVGRQLLQFAHVFGLPYRIFACLLGLVAVMLSVTGVLIWRRKQRGRSHAASRRPG
ncbi:MAG: PepSY domain-containing protein [Pseudomonadales bacterium]